MAVSGLLWHGPPRAILDAARASKIHLFTSAALLAGLSEVFPRPKFARRLERVGVAPDDLVLGYAALAPLVQPAVIAPVILDDPDDDEVLACAVSVQADVIVSGDRDLLSLQKYQHISIRSIRPCEFSEFYRALNLKTYFHGSVGLLRRLLQTFNRLFDARDS
jgi:putative PIN family toxin of toxin-antitoxin system